MSIHVAVLDTHAVESPKCFFTQRQIFCTGATRVRNVFKKGAD